MTGKFSRGVVRLIVSDIQINQLNLAMNKNKISLSHKTVLYGFRLLFRLLFNIDAQGVERTPMEGPLLVASNHTSIYEGPLIFAMMPRHPISPMAKMELKDTILGKLIFHPINSIFVARDEVDRKALKEMIKRLKNNEALGIAPEGTRSPSGTLIQAKEGAAYLALKTDAWVLPIGVWGQENAVSEWKRLRRPTIYVRFGQPFKLQKEPNKTRHENIEIGTERIMHAIARLLPAKYRGYYADAVQGEPEW